MIVTRRTALRMGALGALGLLLPGRAIAAEARAKRCIVLWMDGGPSHLDTFDPKPGTAAGGPFKAIETAASGVRLCEHLPRLAAQAKRFSIVRSLHSREGDHARGAYYLHTGAALQPTVAYPTFGSVIAAQKGPWKAPLPPFVAIGAPFADPGFLGAAHAPLAMLSADDALDGLTIPDDVRRHGRLQRRLALLGALDAGHATRVDPAAVADAIRAREAAQRMLAGETADAFDLSQETEALRARYGDTELGRGCLLARRLVERGTRVVEVSLDGWDTHEDNFSALKDDLLPTLDQAMSALLEDLAQRGLLDDTLVVWMGEFGRTPEINGAGGRDHHPDVFSAVLAGAGVPGGTVVGASDDQGREPKDRPVSVPDLLTTILDRLGVDLAAAAYTTPEGRPIQLLDGGKRVAELG
jgi:uncharacterized protein (DUF1501 family)